MEFLLLQSVAEVLQFFGDLSELAGPILIQILQPKKIVVSLLNLSYKDGNFFFSQWRKFYNFLETCLN